MSPSSPNTRYANACPLALRTWAAGPGACVTMHKWLMWIRTMHASMGVCCICFCCACGLEGAQSTLLLLACISPGHNEIVLGNVVSLCYLCPLLAEIASCTAGSRRLCAPAEHGWIYRAGGQAGCFTGQDGQGRRGFYSAQLLRPGRLESLRQCKAANGGPASRPPAPCLTRGMAGGGSMKWTQAVVEKAYGCY